MVLYRDDMLPQTPVLCSCIHLTVRVYSYQYTIGYELVLHGTTRTTQRGIIRQITGVKCNDEIRI